MQTFSHRVFYNVDGEGHPANILAGIKAGVKKLERVHSGEVVKITSHCVVYEEYGDNKQTPYFISFVYEIVKPSCLDSIKAYLYGFFVDAKLRWPK